MEAPNYYYRQSLNGWMSQQGSVIVDKENGIARHFNVLLKLQFSLLPDIFLLKKRSGHERCDIVFLMSILILPLQRALVCMSAFIEEQISSVYIYIVFANHWESIPETKSSSFGLAMLRLALDGVVQYLPFG